MPTTAAQLVAEVSVSGADKAKSDLQDVGNTTTQTGSTFKSALGGALSLATGVAGQAFGFLKDQLVDSVKVAVAHQGVMAQTAQAIKSTGDVSGMTAQSIGNLSESLSKTTDFSEDTIQSGENLMLTFTGIGEKTFPAATTAMLDLSQATGQDMKSSALQLGKALNDPLTGMTALSRVGVSFSDAEKTSIKTMMAHNDVAGAQAVMLKELNTEFGGSAKAAGQTFAGALQILTNTFDDLKVKIGTAILPILSQLMSVFSTTLLPIIETLGTDLQNTLVPALGDLGAAFGQVGKYLNGDDFAGVIADFQTIGNQIGRLLAPLGAANAQFPSLKEILAAVGSILTSAVIPAIDNVAFGLGQFLEKLNDSAALKQFWSLAQQIGTLFLSNLIPAWHQLQQAMIPLMPALETIGKILGGVLVIAIGLLIGQIIGMAKGIAQAIGGIVQIFTGLIQILTGVFNVAGGLVMFFVDLFTLHFDKLGGDLGQIWTGITQIFSGAWHVIAGVFNAAFGLISGYVSGFIDGIVTYFKGLFEMLVGHSIIPDMINGIVSWFEQLPGRAMAFVSNLVSQITSTLGGLGSLALTWAKDMMTNFVSGIEAGIADIGNAAANIGTAISSHLHFSTPSIGPLAQSDQWMPDMMDMLAKGMNDNLSKIKTASLIVATSISTGTSSPLAGGLQAIPQSMQSATPAQITVQVPDIYLDGRLVSRGLQPHLVQSTRSVTGVKF